MKKLFLLLLVSLLALMSTVYFVSCSENDFGVNFVVDGEDYASISINGNDDVNMPADPTKEGYIFDGWYFDEGVWKAPFAAEQLVNGYPSDSMTVYAKWIESHIHIPSEWIIDSEATCKEPGKKHTECTECGAIVENAIIEKSEEHVVVVDPRVEPTDTSNGLTEGSHCGVCGKVLVAQTVISAQLQGAEIASSSLTVVDEKISGSLGNSMASFSFMNDISVAPGASYIVASDEKFKNTIDDKIASLEIGDNVFYILVTNGSTSKSYTVVIRRLPTYTVRFVTAGGTTVRSQTVEEGSLATAPGTSRTGYTFKGWNFDFTTKITEDITVEASWEANTDTVYKVEYYLENTHKTGYEYPIVENFSGTTASTVTAELKEFKHFKFNEAISVTSGSVNADGSLVLKVYYLRDTYGIDALVNDDARGTVEGGGTYAYGKEITLIATDKPGYIFLGWFEGDFTVCRDAEFTFKVEGDASYTAKWTEDTNTLYTVEYYHENAKKTDFDAPIVQVMAGTTNALVTAEQKEFEHFTFLDTAENVLSGNIDANGNLVLKVYYTRDTYDVAVSVNDSDRGSAFGAGNYIYGEAVTLTASDKRGYTFLGWYDEDGNIVANAGELVRVNDTYPYTYALTFVAERHAGYVAKWALATDTRYTIEYYFENQDKSGYPILPGETEIRTGTTSDEITLIPKEFDHFTFDDIASNILVGTIAPDGNLVLKVYYTRNTYNVGAGVENTLRGDVEGAGTFNYGDEVTLVASNNPGYVFVGWLVDGEIVCDTVAYTFIADRDVECIAKFNVDSYMEETFIFTVDENGWIIEGVKDRTLTEITVPEYVTGIKEGAFAGCSALQSITLPFVGGNAGATKTDVTTLFGYIFGQNSYDGASETVQRYGTLDANLITYYVPSSLTSVTVVGGKINSYSFSNCQTLANVTLNGKVEYIGSNAFENCTNLKNLSISDGVKEIGYEAFGGCTSLENIEIGSSVTRIGEYSFVDCTSLKYLTIPSGVTYVSYCAFMGCTSLVSVIIPDNVEGVGYDTFAGCTGLVEVVIGSGIKEIPNGMFSGCTSLSKVTMSPSNSVTSIGEGAFKNCTSLTSIDIGNEIRVIYSYAFYGCENLQEVNLGAGVTSVYNNAFENCKKLKTLTVSEDLSYIGSGAFAGCTGIERVNVPGIEDWLSLNIYNYPESNPLYCGNGNLYINGQPVTEVVIPDSVTVIKDYAFAGCQSIEKIVVHDNVTSIEYGAFMNCASLEAVEFTDQSGLKTIGSCAFQNCTALKNFDIPANVESLYSCAFIGAGIERVTIPANIGVIDYEMFKDCASLKEVVLHENVREIRKSAFEGCVSLESISFPSSLTTIRENAFKGCSSLTSLTVPDTVKTIEKGAFVNCSGLKTVMIEKGGVESLPEGLFSGCSSIESITLPFVGESHSPSNVDSRLFGRIFGSEPYTGGVEIKQKRGSYIGSNTYYIPQNLKHVTITDMTEVYDGAFSGCTTIKSVTLPEDVTAIGYVAFSGCSGLNTITIPASVTEIGGEAFQNCDSLVSVVIPENVERIGEDAFTDCSRLIEIINKSSVCIPSNDPSYSNALVHSGESQIKETEDGFLFYSAGGVNYLIGYAGEETELTLPSSYNGESYEIRSFAFANCEHLIIPGTITTIGNNMFNGCTGLKSVTIEEGVKVIGEKAFWGCTGLESIVIPGSVEVIGVRAFAACSGLKSVTIGEGVKSIGNVAFFGCSKLTSIVIPDSVETIGNSAFTSCSNLLSVTLGKNLVSIGDNAFDGETYGHCNKIVEVINHSSLSLSPGSFQNGCLARFAKEIHTGESKIAAQGDYLFYTYQGVNYLLAYTGNDTAPTLPESFGDQPYVVYEYAFVDCTWITDITIPGHVTEIPSGMFLGCTGLKSVWISYGVTSIEDSAFEECVNLESISIPDSVTSIDGSVFYDCTNLSSVVIPEGVQSIGFYTFGNCLALESIVLPSTLTTLDKTAFGSCSNLENIYFAGTENQWSQLVSESGWSIPSQITVTCNYTAE